MAAKIFRINYKSDFILTLNSDAGWMTPFCIKFWTGAPSRAYYAGWDGTTYTNCSYDPAEPTKLVVQFDDHHLPIGDLKLQIAYHFTVADFPDDTEDEVINPANITTMIDGEEYQVMLDLTGETAPEIQFSLPAYANEAQRIANEQERQREFAQMQEENAQAVEGAENVNATLNGNILTVTNRNGQSTSVNTKGEAGHGVPAGGLTGQMLFKKSDDDYDTDWQDPHAAGVNSVNGKTGDVTLNASDVGALPSDTPIPTVPNNVSAFNNDAGYVTKTVNDLVNYYLKADVYTKTEVANLIAAIQQFHYEIYASISAVTSPAGNVLYLIGPMGTGSDKYEEYVYDATKQEPWVKIGDTSIDLSGYVTTTALNTALADYTTTSALTLLLAGKQDKQLVIEIDYTDTTLPSGTYNSIITALAVGKDVIIELTDEDSVIHDLPLTYNGVNDDGLLLFSCVAGAIDFGVEVATNNSILVYKRNQVTSVNGQTGDVVITIPDVSTKEDVTTIEAPVDQTDATLPITTLVTEVGKYYRIDVAVDTLAVTLPAMTDLTTVRTVVIYLTAGTTPAVTISSTAPTGGTAPDVYYQDGYAIEAGKTYEVNCLWNGVDWIVASVEIVVTNNGE